MKDNELQQIWKIYDQKMDAVLAVNKSVAIDLARQKLSRQIGQMTLPKRFAVVIGVPYTLLLVTVTIIAAVAEAYLVAFGFGVIALVMCVLLGNYIYQLFLIDQVKNSDDILQTQKQLAELELSSLRSLYLAVFQLPFWSVCWMSIDALRTSPLLYGGINLFVFLALVYLAFWIYQNLNNSRSKVRHFLLSGREWDPMVKAETLLDQIREYEQLSEYKL